MEPALDVIGRTLLGDSGARAFLESTTSIYVLDVTDPRNPKTYGCWNFIHQALNEVERYESSLNGNSATTEHHHPNNNGSNTNNNANHSPSHFPPGRLVPHVRLLASMALKVARRSHKGDRSIVATCIANVSDYHCSASQAQWLLDLNLELREIVMGRIAAIAFDFSFHRPNHPPAPTAAAAAGQGDQPNCLSAFADAVVMDTLSAVLAANAVAAGPGAVRHFATEWIIPSSRNIPVRALVSVTHHLALEGMWPTSPAGTMDMLQQLSVPICSLVLVPAMADAATDNNDEWEQSSSSVHANNSRILAKTLMALDVWCAATCLSLPQLRHISNKMHLNLVEIINDVMYSDSPEVVDAMADFIDRVMESPLEKEISEDRMNQVRHVINVNESAFKANFSAEHLRVIENKEISSILDELSCSVGLQRMRFVELQNQGKLEVCRNLARIGRGVAAAWLEVYSNDENAQPERGLVDFLFKTVSHPSVKIHGVTLDVTSKFVSNRTSLGRELLPILQRKAIIPHHTNEAGILSLLHTDQYGVTIEEFLLFREHVIADALAACWKFDSEVYLNSCTSAIEEFCSGEAGANLSFHLEAALFCVESVGSILAGSELCAFSGQVSRCVASLSKKATCITSNPLAVARMALFLQKWAVWFQRNQKIASAGDLAVTSLSYSLVLSHQTYAQNMVRDTGTLPVLQSCLALKEIISVEPGHFATESNLNALIVVWQSLYSERKRGMPVSLDSIEPLGKGMCTAILHASEELRPESFESLVSPLIDSIDQLLALVKITSDEQNSIKLHDCIAGELRLLASLIRTFSSCPSAANADARMEEDDDRDDCDNRHTQRGRWNLDRDELPPYVISVIRRCWPSIRVIATDFHDISTITGSICELLSESIPCRLDTDEKMTLLKDLLSILSSMLETITTTNPSLVLHVGHVLEAWVAVYGEDILEWATIEQNSIDAMDLKDGHNELAKTFLKVLLELVQKGEPCLGSAWIGPGSDNNIQQQQQQGQAAFESRPPPTPQLRQSDCQCLGPVLSLLGAMRQVCPEFLLSCPVARNDSNNLLISKATTSAVQALGINDSSLVLGAIDFLLSMIRPRDKDSESVKVKLRDNVPISRAGVLSHLMLGCCGRYEHAVLEPTADLLLVLMRHYPSQQVEADISSAFQQQQQGFFQLGDEAKQVVRICLIRKCSPAGQNDSVWSRKELGRFLEQIWDMHRTTDGISTVPESDAVARFIRRYLVC